MTQQFTDIQETTSVKTSLSQLMNNFKTIMSNSAGDNFPTTNLQQGMSFYKTDEDKLYLLKNATGAIEDWDDTLFGGGNHQIEIIKTTGVWNKPNNLRKALIIVQGAGGAGGVPRTAVIGVAGGGGQAGATAYVFADADNIPNSVQCTIGIGGAAVIPLPTNSSAAGNAGTTTSFGELIYAYGGLGGFASNGQYQRSPGGGQFYSTGGSVLEPIENYTHRAFVSSDLSSTFWVVHGEYGIDGVNYINSSSRFSTNINRGNGGSSPFGTGGANQIGDISVTGINNRNGRGYGSGGLGGGVVQSSTSSTGYIEHPENGAGAPGVIIIVEAF